jgi:hypothetical protein
MNITLSKASANATPIVQVSKASSTGTVQWAPRQGVQAVAPVWVSRHGDVPSWHKLRFLVVRSTTNTIRLPSTTGVRNGKLQATPAENFRAAEMAWLQEHYDEVAQKYPGEWIALDGPGLVGHAADLATLLALTGAAGHPDPFVTGIPGDPIASLHL